MRPTTVEDYSPQLNLSTVKPYRAEARTANFRPEDTLKLGCSGDHSAGTFGYRLGAASAALGPALQGYTDDRLIRLRGELF